MTAATAVGPTDVPLLHETIGHNLEATVARFPDHEALVVIHQGIRQTYREFDATVDRVARGLLALGIERGDRVGMWSPNFAEWVWIQYATAKIGAIQVNVNPAYRTNELQYALAQSGCRLLVTRTSYLTSDYRAMVDEVAPSVPTLERTLCFDTDDWGDLLAAGESVPIDALRSRSDELEPGDPINIQYTSGTTGRPKGATLSHVNILNNARFVGAGCGYTEHDRIGIPVPFYHCFGMVMGNLAATAHGAAMIVPMPDLRPRRGARRGRGRADHQPLRRTDHVHRRARPPRPGHHRSVVAADRDHGRIAVPGRGHEAGHRRDEHGRGHHLLRHDRDLAGLDPDRGRRLDREAHADRRTASTPTSRSRSSTPPPVKWWSGAAPMRRSAASSAPVGTP